MLVWSFSLFTL